METVPTKRRKLESGCFGGFLNNILCNPSPSSTFEDASSLSLPQFPTHVTTTASANQSSADDDVDQLLASEMYKLSVDERNRAYDDLHGISTMTNEDPNLVETKLVELTQALEAIRPRDKTAYTDAMTMNPEYVSDPKLRLMFLRAKQFDANEAATQMVNFFDVKRRLFGDAKLTETIQWSDITEEDRKSVAEGAMRPLSQRDSAGRAIFLKIK